MKYEVHHVKIFRDGSGVYDPPKVTWYYVEEGKDFKWEYRHNRMRLKKL